MRKVIIYLAISLDGYISDTLEKMDWLKGDGSEPDHLGSYNDFYATIDTIIMGKNTYDLINQTLSPNAWPYPHKKTYVFTHKHITPQKDIEFLSADLTTFVNNLKQQKGKDIWVCGGASIAMQLLQLDLVDKITLTIVPTILGDGIKFFQKFNQSIQLKLIDIKSYNGFVDLTYQKLNQ